MTPARFAVCVGRGVEYAQFGQSESTDLTEIA